MAKQSLAQRIGRRGQRWFESQLPDSWLVQEPRNNDDASIDYTVTIADGSRMSGLHFRVQVKAKQAFQIKDAKLILRGVKRSSAEDWIIGPVPTLLVLYDCSNDTGFCAWANSLVAEQVSIVQGSSATVTIGVPTNRPLHPAVWDELASDLLLVNELFFHSTIHWLRQHLILSAIRELAEAYKAVAYSTVVEPRLEHRTDDQREVLSELELLGHRDAVRTAIRLREVLGDEGLSIDGLDGWIVLYKAACDEFAFHFDDMLQSESRVQIGISHELMTERRPALLFQQVSLIRSLATIMTANPPKGVGMALGLRKE